MSNNICILGAGIGGLVTLLSVIKNLQQTDMKDIPRVNLYEKRSEDDFDKRPQLLVISDLGAEKDLQELLGEEEYLRISKGKAIHIGDLQRSLWTAIKNSLEANPKLKEFITVNFESDARILDMPKGIVRFGKSTFKYDCIINATGSLKYTKDLAYTHDVKYKEYDYQERVPQHAAVMFFLPSVILSPDQKISIQSHVPIEELKKFGWYNKESPNVYILSKPTASGTVFSVVGEFPNDNKKIVTDWMRYILEKSLDNKGISHENLKIMQATDDASLANYTNDKLSTQVFPIDMQHIESTIYQNKNLGDSIGVTIGNAASSANPHLASGAVIATIQGYTLGKILSKEGKIDIQDLNSYFQTFFKGLNTKMRGQQALYGYKISSNLIDEEKTQEKIKIALINKTLDPSLRDVFNIYFAKKSKENINEALACAVCSGSVDLIYKVIQSDPTINLNELVKISDVNNNVIQSMPVLQYAIETGNVDIVSALLEYGADPRIKRAFNQSSKPLSLQQIRNKKKTSVEQGVDSFALADKLQKPEISELLEPYKQGLALAKEIQATGLENLDNVLIKYSQLAEDLKGKSDYKFDYTVYTVLIKELNSIKSLRSTKKL